MPELPDIVILARSMEEALHGKRIAEVTVNQSKCINLDPVEYAQAIVGGRVERVRQRGKLAVMDLDNGWSLWFSLGMGGEVVLQYPREEPDPGRERVLYHFEDGFQPWAHFWWFGNIHALPTEELEADHRLARVGVTVSAMASPPTVWGRCGTGGEGVSRAIYWTKASSLALATST